MCTFVCTVVDPEFHEGQMLLATEEVKETCDAMRARCLSHPLISPRYMSTPHSPRNSTSESSTFRIGFEWYIPFQTYVLPRVVKVMAEVVSAVDCIVTGTGVVKRDGSEQG